MRVDYSLKISLLNIIIHWLDGKSVCAGYFLQEATRLIQTGLYDSIISFASGLSLLTYLIAEKNPQFSGVFFDTDFPYMIEQRNERIAAIADKALDSNVLKKLQSMIFDMKQRIEKIAH